MLLKESVVSSVLEIVDLANGDIVLQQADGDAEPMVTIRFSDEANTHLHYLRLEVAKAMIQAGIQAYAELAEQIDQATLEEHGDAGASHTIH